MSIITHKIDNESFIRTYEKFKKIWEQICVDVVDHDEFGTNITKSKIKTNVLVDYNELGNLNKTKCYFGPGSYPAFISSWEVKTNALLYDIFIFDVSTFRNVVIGGLPSGLDNENEILKWYRPIDFEVSNILMKLYKNNSIKFVNSSMDDLIDRDEFQELEKSNKLYTKGNEIETISKRAALFPGDEFNVPGLLGMINEDILISYLTNSSIITREYTPYIERKLDEHKKTKFKFDIIDLLLEYEVPNFSSLDFNKINSIRNLNSLSSLKLCTQSLTCT